MRMAATLRTTWNIIKVVNSFDREGDVIISFNEAKVSPDVGYLWEFYLDSFVYVTHGTIALAETVCI